MSPPKERSAPWKPTREELAAAYGKKVPDVVAPNLDVLFCGINPGLYSGAVGHHFARPGNRFWPALHGSGLTPRLVSPFDEHDLLDWGLGVTNIVARTTARADELDDEEIRRGAATLVRKVKRLRPRVLAPLGLVAYRIGFGVRAAEVGLQEQTVGETRIWLLPNPSGLNAHYQLPDLVAAFRQLRAQVRAEAPKGIKPTSGAGVGERASNLLARGPQLLQ